MWGVGVVWGCVWGCVWVVGRGCGGKVGVGFVWTLLGTEASVALNTKTHLRFCMQMNSKSCHAMFSCVAVQPQEFGPKARFKN